MMLMKQVIERQVADIRSMVPGLEEIDLDDHQSMGLSAMHYAAWYNNHKAVQTLIEWGQDVKARDVEGATPLHYVARYKNRVAQVDASGTEKKPTSPKMVIQSLLSAGAELNGTDKMGVTPLANATLRGNKEAVEELLRQPDIDVLSADKRGVTSLHVAAKYDRPGIARLLVARLTSDDILHRDDLGETAMHIAAEEDHVEIMNILLEAMPGKESEVINALTDKNEAPIDLAVENRNHQATEILLKHNALLRKMCRTGNHSPMHMACAAGAPRIVKLLLDKDPFLLQMRSNDMITPLHRAVQFDRPKVTKILLENNVDIDARDSVSNSPLHVAVLNGSHRSLNVLIDHGALLDALNKKDRTVLHLAALNNRPKTLKICLEHMKKAGFLDRVISSDDRLGNSPLHLAAEGGHQEIVEMLHNHGAYVRNKNQNEATAIHVASKYGRTSVVRHLLKITDEMNEDVSLSILHDEDEDGNTPLHLAALNGHPKVVELLLESKAEDDTINRKLWPPLLCAAEGGHLECVLQLIKNQCELTACDGNKSTALHLAAHGGHYTVVEALLQHGAKLDALDENGHNPLDIALLMAHREVAEVIVKSEKWRDALRNRSFHGSSKMETTPFRQLVRKMPEVAEIVLDQCIQNPDGRPILDPDLTLVFDFEFVDDAYTSSHWEKDHDDGYDPDKTLDSTDLKIAIKNRPIASNMSGVENHVLMTMCDAQRSDLLHHPLCLALMQRKWRLAQFFFFTFLVFYIIFVAALTAFFLYETPPYTINGTYYDSESIEECREEHRKLAEESSFMSGPDRYWGRAGLVITLAVIGMTVEVIQLIHTRLGYFDNFSNLLDWFTYVASILVVVPFNACGLRLEWQWKLGAMCMFGAWINLISFLRRLPTMGLYIAMVGEVFITFIKFFVFCFSLFLFAFGITFFMLFGNQDQFRTPLYSFFKMAVMLIGELDYGDMFHSDDPDEVVVYEDVSYLIFIMFLCLVTMVIMNLLTGLAVGDVQQVQEQAALKRMTLQVGLALDVENCLPLALRKKLICHHTKVSMQPNKTRGWLKNKFVQIMDGPMSAKSIAKLLYQEYEEELEEARERRKDRNSGLNNFRSQKLIAQINENRDQLKGISKNVERIEAMLEALLHHNNVPDLDEEDGKNVPELEEEGDENVPELDELDGKKK